MLSKTESELLLAIITSNTDKLTGGKRLDKAKESLIKKGFLRVNKHRIVELNLCCDYYEQRGYKNKTL